MKSWHLSETSVLSFCESPATTLLPASANYLTLQLIPLKKMLAPGLFGAARRSLFTFISSATAPPGVIISSIVAGRAGAGVGTGAGPLTFVRGMAKKKGGRVQDRRVRMSLSLHLRSIRSHNPHSAPLMLTTNLPRNDPLLTQPPTDPPPAQIRHNAHAPPLDDPSRLAPLPTQTPHCPRARA